MFRVLPVCALLIASLPLSALDVKRAERTLYFENLGSLKAHLHDAVMEQGLKVAGKHLEAAVLIRLDFTDRSLWAQEYLRAKLGRTENATLTAVDKRTGKTLVTFDFRLENLDESHREAAQRFARMLARKL